MTPLRFQKQFPCINNYVATQKSVATIFLGVIKMTTMTKVAHFTCDVCEVIRDLVVKFMKKTWLVCTAFGYARAAGELRRYNMIKEANLMMEYARNPSKK